MIEKRIKKTEEEIDGLLSLIVEVTSKTVLSTYERRISELERKKLVLVEQAANTGQPKRPFDETFRTALAFLENPRKFWDSGEFIQRRMLLKLAFTARIHYQRNEGFRTAQPSVPFELLNAFAMNGKMVPPVGIEPTLP